MVQGGLLWVCDYSLAGLKCCCDEPSLMSCSRRVGWYWFWRALKLSDSFIWSKGIDLSASNASFKISMMKGASPVPTCGTGKTAPATKPPEQVNIHIVRQDDLETCQSGYLPVAPWYGLNRLSKLFDRKLTAKNRHCVSQKCEKQFQPPMIPIVFPYLVIRPIVLMQDVLSY